MADSERRRRRLRHGFSGPGSDRADGTAGTSGDHANGTGGSDDRSRGGRSAESVTAHDPSPGGQPGSRRSPGNGSRSEDRDGERGLRGLVGSGASQVSIGAALRARDAARPTEADLAEAEEHLVIVRRNWVPREDLPRHGR